LGECEVSVTSPKFGKLLSRLTFPNGISRLAPAQQNLDVATKLWSLSSCTTFFRHPSELVRTFSKTSSAEKNLGSLLCLCTTTYNSSSVKCSSRSKFYFVTKTAARQIMNKFGIAGCSCLAPAQHIKLLVRVSAS
jgi:hypothetical protein